MNRNVLVLFDVDGTLITSITSSAEHEESFSKAFETVYGVKTNIDIINHHGMTDQEIIIEVLKKNDLTECEIKSKITDCMDAMIESFQALVRGSNFRPLRGVRKLLEELTKRGILLGLVTGNLKEIAREKMRKSGLNHYFKFGGFGNEDINRVNLVRIAIKRAKQEFNFKPDSIFLFGDSPQDIKAAKEAGIKAIGVTTGIYSKGDLLERNPDYVLEDLTDTNKILTILEDV